MFHRSRGERDKEPADFDEAIHLAPKHVWVFLGTGLLYVDKGDFSKALADYNEAVRLFPKMAWVYSARAGAYAPRAIRTRPWPITPKRFGWRRRMPRLTLPEPLFIKTAGTSTKPWPTTTKRFGSLRRMSGVRVSYRDRGDFEKALADSNEAIRLNPNDASTYGSRAVTYRAMGQLDKVLADMNESMRLDPEELWGGRFSRPRSSRTWRFRPGPGRLQRSDSNEYPRFVVAYSARASLHSDRGDFEKALADYNEAIRIAPENSSCYCERGTFYLDRREFQKRRPTSIGPWDCRSLAFLQTPVSRTSDCSTTTSALE